MTPPTKYRRFALLALSLIAAAASLLLSGSGYGDSISYEASGVYRSELLDKEVSVATLEALTYTEDFQGVVAGQVEVTSIPESPYHIRVHTSVGSESDLHNAHKRAVDLLSLGLKEQALTDVKSSLAYLESVKKKAGELTSRREADEISIKASLDEHNSPVLSTTDSNRVLFLKKQIENIETYLTTGVLSDSVRIRLDRQSLDSLEEKVRERQSELRRLAKIFHPTSGAVQAQRVSLEEAQADLALVERELAEVYLRSLRLELETLDDKASSRIREGLAKQSLLLDSDKPTAEARSAWLDERRKELEQRAEVVSRAAALELEGKITTWESRPYSSGIVILGWGISLLFFLAAIFFPLDAGLSPGEHIAKSDPSPRFGDRVQPSRSLDLRLVQSARERLQIFPPDRMERFFTRISEELHRQLGHPPRKLLVLGDAAVETRMGFSIRLANSLCAEVERVRLIDFDFQDKGLSRRLGRRELPGVGELMLDGGAVEEFFSSISGTRIQFAPAGNHSSIVHAVGPERVAQILGTRPGEISIVDATSASPLHLLVDQVDAVLWSAGCAGSDLPSAREREVLLALRQGGLPVIGVSLDSLELFSVM